HDVDLAFLRQHHHRDTGNRLRHGKDAKHALDLHGSLLLAVLITDCLPVHHFPVASDHQHGPWDCALIHFRLKKLRDAVQPFRGEAGFFWTAELWKLLGQQRQRASEQYKKTEDTSSASHAGSSIRFI